MLAMVVLSKLEEVKLAYSFSSIPLDASIKQPEKLLVLEYAGHPSPLTVNVGQPKEKNGFQTSILQLINHSNKEILEVRVTLTYFDAAGKQLKDDKVGLVEFLPFSDGPPILVKAGATREREQALFFYPATASKIVARISTILFADGTEWKSESTETPPAAIPKK